MKKDSKWNLSEDRYFDPDPAQRRIATTLYQSVAHLPILSPHSHVDPRLLADENSSFGTPADLLIIPDHYVFRMFYSHGIPLERLGIQGRDGGPAENDHRKVWQTFADHFFLFRSTPTGNWLADELGNVFGIKEKLTGKNAQSIYDQIGAKLKLPEFKPRALFKRFNIEVLCTTDAATDSLIHHQALHEVGWGNKIRPTFRPDAVINLLTPSWSNHINTLGKASGITITSYKKFIRALEHRRAFFQSMGALATDHALETAYTEELTPSSAEIIFKRAIQGKTNVEDSKRFNAHMIMEFARMSIEDGLVMQLHVGSIRDHNDLIYRRFGPNMGADIPSQIEFTKNLRPLLNKYGNDPRLTLILFTLDESTYSRELAPLAGHYPAVKLGPPWWFYDSPNGMRRYLDRVMETAGLHNTAGFNDDTRAFPSIPARHDLWRRVGANWIAGLVVRGIVDKEDAKEMILDLAYRLAKKAYKIP
jgi:glucuronate isomerase